MQYTTTPGLDFRRLLLGFAIAIVGCYFLIAVIPFGLAMDFKISNRTSLPGDDLKRLLTSVREHSLIKTTSEAYFETLMSPWDRMQYSNYVIVDGGPKTYQVELISTSPNGTVSYSYTASMHGREWKLDLVSSMMKMY